VTADYLLRRTRSLQIARSMMIAVSWTLAVAALVPAIFVHDLVLLSHKIRHRVIVYRTTARCGI
jgi:hypothetical protein